MDMTDASGLRVPELTERERSPGNVQIEFGIARDLQERALLGASLVVLAGRMEEAWPPTERGRTTGTERQLFPRSGHLGTSMAIDEGLDRNVAVPGIDSQEQPVDGICDGGGSFGQQPVRGVDGDIAVNKIGFRMGSTAVEQSPGGLLCVFHIGLVEGIDADDPPSFSCGSARR